MLDFLAKPQAARRAQGRDLNQPFAAATSLPMKPNRHRRADARSTCCRLVRRANRDGLVVGALVAAAIVARHAGRCGWIGQRMLAAKPSQHLRLERRRRPRARQDHHLLHGRGGDRHRRDLRRSRRRAAQRLVDIGFIIAFALQGAIWARELILGVIAPPRRRRNRRNRRSATRMAIIRVLVSVALFAHRDHRHPRQSRGQRHRAGRRPRHRRHRHRPRRAGHLLRPVRGARRSCSTSRSGAATPSATEHRRTGTVERIGLKTTRLRSVDRRAGDHGQHQAARAGGAQPRRGQGPAHLAAVQPDLPDPAGNASSACPRSPARRSKPIKSCKLVRCVATAFGPSSIDCELVYDDRTHRPGHAGPAQVGDHHRPRSRLRARRIAFAYPTQTTFTAAPDGTLVMP